MEQMVVKTEQSGEILLFYVDENGGNEEGVITTIENIEQGQLEDLQQGNFIIEEVSESSNEQEYLTEDQSGKERWLDEEIKRLLIFFIDNKETFLSGTTKKKHLWTVACKTMLPAKNPQACEIKLRNMKRKYSLTRIENAKKMVDDKNMWQYYDLCHLAFHDDSHVKSMLSNDNIQHEFKPNITEPSTKPTSDVVKYNEGILQVKKPNTRQVDESIEYMLNLYVQHKKLYPLENRQKELWEKVTLKLGENPEYWHKRFLNYKQHYIRMVDKRKESGPESINWPYMALYDEIFANDEDFKRKFVNPQTVPNPVVVTNDVIMDSKIPIEWDETEKTVLIKYYFDCYDEFRDPTIPDSFLWSEVGRLLDKPPEMCKKKYEELKLAHFNRYLIGGYNIRDRIPISILFDNIISKESEAVLCKGGKKVDKSWTSTEVDELVQFFHDNTELFKDPICYYVCWAAVSKKLMKPLLSCREQWRCLTSLYSSILADKKEDQELQINWRYIELFDRIFDYGMDTKMLEGYEKIVDVDSDTKEFGKAQKQKRSNKGDDSIENPSDEDEDDKSSIERSRGTGDPKHFKILEYHLKHKDKFKTGQKKNPAAQWQALAQQLGLTAKQCAHRFRNLKQVYMGYIQREINKPEMPIMWPYYALCKKVFGYRVIKNKLKNVKVDSDDSEEWTAKKIKQVINYFAKHFHVINNNTENRSNWAALSRDIDMSETSCRDKFLELRKSYRKIKTMMSRNPECKVNWKYFKMFDEIYANEESLAMEVDNVENREYVPLELPTPQNIIKNEMQEDDDYQCIIIMPDGEEFTSIENAQIIKINNDTEIPAEKTIKKNKSKKLWNLRTKKLLLKRYLKYIKAHEGQIIDIKDMWTVIASTFPHKEPIHCKRMYGRLRVAYKNEIDNPTSAQPSPYHNLFTKIFALLPKLRRRPFKVEDIVLPERETYTDIKLPSWKVEKGLKYYLDHIEEFFDPRYDKKYAWIELGAFMSAPATKAFTKIHYLKQFFNIETNEVAGQKFEFSELLREILEKEIICKIAIEYQPKPAIVDENAEDVYEWSDDEIEQLLIWYLENLAKFKNPKFVRSYLWIEAANVLNKTALVCSKKMSEIRTQYSNMVKENPEALREWRFHGLCRRIYGTGKKSSV